MIKIFFKEDWILLFVDWLLFVLVLVIAFVLLLLLFVIILIIFGWGVVDMYIGLLFFLVMVGVNVYVVLFGGWSSGNKYVLLGVM